MDKLLELIWNYIDDNRTKGVDATGALTKLLNSLKQYKKQGYLNNENEESLKNVTKEIIILNPKDKYRALNITTQRIQWAAKQGIIESEDYSELISDIVMVIKKNYKGCNIKKILDPCSGIGTVPGKLKLRNQDFQIACKEISKDLFEIMKDIYYICDITADLENTDSLSKHIDEKQDLAVFNPPYSTKLHVKDLSMEELTERRINKISLESAFLIKALEYVKENGIIVATIPSSFLFNISNKPIRDIILEKTQVLMILDAPKRSFENSSISISIIVLRKKKNNEGDTKELLVGSLEETVIGTADYKREKEKLLESLEQFLREESNW